MTKKFKYTVKEARKFNKHGIDLAIYGQDEPSANVCHVSVNKGHFQEFYDIKSAFTYYIIKGEGTFFLDDEPVKVEATDLVVIPPNTRIHYFGTMEMVLTISPAWEEKNERHVRFVEENESPYA
ncbi:MAG TPA: cupin domain-containing protein [Candidatus Saccharimonadales bacterium]